MPHGASNVAHWLAVHGKTKSVEQLSPEEYEVLREKGTERAFTGEYWDNHEDGMFRCAGCGAELFSSDTKFESGSGWPSFWDVIEGGNVELRTDFSHGMTRVEAVCARCGSHLGHVFDDGPRPTGERFCMNSISLALELDDRDGPSDP